MEFKDTIGSPDGVLGHLWVTWWSFMTPLGHLMEF